MWSRLVQPWRSACASRTAITSRSRSTIVISLGRRGSCRGRLTYVALFLGYGRRRAGRVGDDLGYDAYSVRPVDQPWLAKGNLRKTGTSETLAVTQLHHRMEGLISFASQRAGTNAAEIGYAAEFISTLAIVDERMGHGDRSRFLYRLQCLRRRLYGREQRAGGR